MTVFGLFLHPQDPYANQPPRRVIVRHFGIAKAIRVKTRSNGDIKT